MRSNAMWQRIRRAIPVVAAVLFLITTLSAQPPAGRGGAPPPPPREAALFDPTGYWVSVVTEDWRWRMLTPPKGDFASVPLNAEGQKVGNAWDAAADEAAGKQCMAYGAAGLMRLPLRLHVTWADEKTLKIETDAGKQTRTLVFGPPPGPPAPPSMQGNSAASWEKQLNVRGFGGRFGGPTPGGGGSLKVVTTNMTGGYLRKNGVPYGTGAVLTEFFDRVEIDGNPWLILTSVVDDRQYLNDTFITSQQFKKESDGSKWDPQPCKTR